MENLNNIWSAEDELNDQQLIDYIKNKSAAGDAHNIEKKMINSAFENDSIEGLQQFSSVETINTYVQQLNQSLHQKLFSKKTKNKKDLFNLSWEIIAVIIVILLCLLGYVFIQMLQK